VWKLKGRVVCLTDSETTSTSSFALETGSQQYLSDESEDADRNEENEEPPGEIQDGRRIEDEGIHARYNNLISEQISDQSYE